MKTGLAYGVVVVLAAVAGLATGQDMRPPAPLAELHLGPGENLPAIDLALIQGATRSIDMLAYVLGDREIVRALVAARHRGVAVRLVIDNSEFPSDQLDGLLDVTRVKRGNELMHEKAMAVDGAVLRTGSENFTYAARYQTNDLVVIRDSALVAKFEKMFEELFAASEAAE